MPRHTTVLQVFVASPSDVSEERAALEAAITQLNQVWSGNLGIIFELVKWETNVHPSFRTDPQAVINEQIGSDYDVFIGIFWGRVGSPTPRARSGAIEEFERAYERFKRTNKVPEIMLYFKDAPISPSKIDVEQLKTLQDFKASLTGKGGLYSVFEDQPGFESSLRAHLAAIAQKFAAQPPSGQTRRTELVVSPAEVSEENDYGYFDCIEIFEARSADMNAAIDAINEATIRVGEQLRQRSAEIEAGNKADPKSARRLIKRAADDMNSYADTISSQITLLSTARKQAFDALADALAIRGDLEPKGADLPMLRQSLATVISSIEGAKSVTSGMRESANGLPRMTKEINKAKRSVVAQLDLFIAELDSAGATLDNIIEAIERMLGGQPQT